MRKKNKTGHDDSTGLRNQAEEALQQSELRYRALFDGLSNPIAVYDRDGYFLMINSLGAENFRKTAAEIVEKSLKEFLPDVYERLVERIRRVIDQKKNFQAEDLIKLPGGEERWFWSTLEPVKNINGAIYGVQVISYDITERKRAEEALQRAHDQLEQLVEEKKEKFNRTNEALRMEITERKRAEEEAVQHAKNIEFLSETAMGFVELPAAKDIYWFIGEKLRQIIDDAIYILVNSFDQKTGEIKVRALLADDRNRQAVSKTLGAFPLGISFAVSEEAWNGLISGKLVRVPGGIHELSFGKIPKAACDALEKLAGTGDIFTMGFARKGELYGSATIIMREGSQLSNRDVVETLVRQAGVALQRKRAEEALRESQKRFQALTETTNDFIWEMDANGVYTYCSPQIYELWGYKPEEMIGRTPFDLMIPEDREHAVRMFRTISESPRSFKGLETSSRDNTGRIVVLETSGIPFFDIDGRLSGYRGISRDITERKRAEEALKRSEEKFRSLAENINLGIYRTTVGPEGKFIEANPAIIKMFGYKSKEEFLAINVSDLYQNPEDRNKFNDKMLKEGFVIGEELRLKKKDGTFLVGSVSVVAVKDEDGYVKYYDGIIENITERKQAEEVLRKSESQLRALTLELSLIEERERKRLALYLHDEIGQSLALIRMKFGSLGGVWKLKSGKQNIQQIRDLLEKVIDQTHTLTFELSPPVLHQLGLEAAIEWAGEKISQDFGIEFMFSDDGMIKPLSTDIKALLFRCVRELMSNIVKHAKAKRMTISLTRREERIFVVLEDDGVGFDMSLSGRQQNKVGFGLFSVRERLGAAGGSYEFQSEPGRGTRIILSVPLKEEMPSS